MEPNDDNVVPFRPRRSIRTFVEEVMDDFPRAKGAILFVRDEDDSLQMYTSKMNSRMLASAGARLIYLSGRSWHQDD